MLVRVNADKTSVVHMLDPAMVFEHPNFTKVYFKAATVTVLQLKIEI